MSRSVLGSSPVIRVAENLSLSQGTHEDVSSQTEFFLVHVGIRTHFRIHDPFCLGVRTYFSLLREQW